MQPYQSIHSQLKGCCCHMQAIPPNSQVNTSYHMNLNTAFPSIFPVEVSHLLYLTISLVYTLLDKSFCKALLFSHFGFNLFSYIQHCELNPPTLLHFQYSNSAVSNPVISTQLNFSKFSCMFNCLTYYSSRQIEM